MSTTLRFEREKETANMVRFAEVNDPTEYPSTRGIYLTKQWDASNGKPSKLTVTVEAN